MRRIIIWLLSALLLFSYCALPPAQAAGLSLISPTGSMSIKGDYHGAIDFLATRDTTIKAAAAGWVEAIWTGCENWDGVATGVTCRAKGCPSRDAPFWNDYCNNGAGVGVVLGHRADDGIYLTLYSHLDYVDASLLQKWKSRSGAVYVNAGTALGKAGSRGMSSGVHLHFALFKERMWNAVDPRPFMHIPPGRLEDIAKVYVDGITETNAVLRYQFFQKRYAWSSGAFLGTSPDDLKQVQEVVNGQYPYAWYDASKWFGTLEPGTRYYYKLFCNYGYRDYISQLYEFTTLGKKPVITTATVTEREQIPFDTQRRANDRRLTTFPERLVQQGAYGQKELTYLVTYADGMEIGRELQDEKVIFPPIDSIIEYGTRDPNSPVRGDADGDGNVDTNDVVCVIDYVVSDIPCRSPKGANAHEDEQIDVHDLLWIIRAVIR